MAKSNFTAQQQAVFNRQPERWQKAILAGYPITIVSLKDDEKPSVTFNKENICLDKFAMESLARCLLPQIHEYFSNEENVREFEKWKKEQNK